MLRRPTVPWALVAAGIVMESAWLLVTFASIPVTESRGFTSALLELTGVSPWLALVGRPTSRWGALLLVGGLVLASGGYLAAIGVMLRSRRCPAPGWILGCGLIFTTTLLIMPGLLSSDIVGYAAIGRLGAVYGMNPYVNPQAAISFDTIVQWVGGGPEHATPYGPLWTAVNVTLAHLTAPVHPVGQVIVYRLVGAITYAANGYMVWRLIPLIEPDSEPGAQWLALLVYAWNPLVLLELVGGGHNDGLMLSLALGGLVVLATAKRWRAALVMVWAGALVKALPVVLMLYIGCVWLRAARTWRGRILQVASVATLSAAVTLVLLWPWHDLQDPVRVLDSVSTAGERYVNGLVDLPTSWLAAHWLDREGRDIRAAEASVRAWTTAAVRLAFVAYVIVEIRHLLWSTRGQLRDIVETSTRTLFFVLLVVSTQVMAWYYTWPLTLGAALGWRSTLSKLAVAYAVLYLPVFYAIHENLVTTIVAPALVVGYALLPVALVRLARRIC